MTSLRSQQAAASPPATTSASLAADVRALELQIAEQIAHAKALMAAQPNKAMEERVQRIAGRVAADQAQLEVLNVRLRQALEVEGQGLPQNTAPPGTVIVPPPVFGSPPMDRDTAMLGIAVTALVLAPLALAFAWRLIRRTGPSANSHEWIESNERMRRVEQSVESIAIEIERISEHQRFITHAMTEPLTPIPARRERVQLEHPTPV